MSKLAFLVRGKVRLQLRWFGSPEPSAGEAMSHPLRSVVEPEHTYYWRAGGDCTFNRGHLYGVYAKLYSSLSP